MHCLLHPWNKAGLKLSECEGLIIGQTCQSKAMERNRGWGFLDKGENFPLIYPIDNFVFMCVFFETLKCIFLRNLWGKVMEIQARLRLLVTWTYTVHMKHQEQVGRPDRWCTACCVRVPIHFLHTQVILSKKKWTSGYIIARCLWNHEQGVSESRFFPV